MLHLEGALSEAELAAGVAAVEQGLEEGKRGEIWCLNKQMESLCFHPALWPIVMELTNGKPKLKGGQMIIDDHERGLGLVSGEGGHLHCAREDWGPESASFDIHEGEIRANDFIVFICAPSRLPAAGAGAPLTTLLLQTSQTWRRGTGGECLASLHVRALFAHH